MMNKDRVAILIGKNGKTKKIIEEFTHTQIEIDSETGEYTINPAQYLLSEKDLETSNEDLLNTILEESNLDEISLKNMSYEPSFSVWIAGNIIKAINIGFKPEKALTLLDQENSFEIIYLEKIFGNSEKKIKRIMGRIIGEKGKMRMAIEQFNKAYVSIFPKKRVIGLIGDFESLKIARKAINMIVDGLPHNVVMNFLHKKYQERKEQEFRDNWTPSFE